MYYRNLDNFKYTMCIHLYIANGMYYYIRHRN